MLHSPFLTDTGPLIPLYLMKYHLLPNLVRKKILRSVLAYKSKKKLVKTKTIKSLETLDTIRKETLNGILKHFRAKKYDLMIVKTHKNQKDLVRSYQHLPQDNYTSLK